jgi:glyoxylase-like metal-dependent hydrolase (beta-lactamase superfamily II)
MKRSAVYVLMTGVVIGILQRQLASQINTVKELAPGVYFHEGDLRGKGHCNNGWVIFEDYVLVLDANFPSGAQEILPKIKAQTSKPIRFAFDTHHHGDHAYGNQVWADNGAVPVAHENVVAEMRKYDTGIVRREARAVGARGDATRRSQRDAAEGADAALSRSDDLR